MLYPQNLQESHGMSWLGWDGIPLEFRPRIGEAQISLGRQYSQREQMVSQVKPKEKVPQIELALRFFGKKDVISLVE